VRSGLLAAAAILTSWSLRTLQEQMIIAKRSNGFGLGDGAETGGGDFTAFRIPQP
jgi:hypothetical protein